MASVADLPSKVTAARKTKSQAVNFMSDKELKKVLGKDADKDIRFDDEKGRYVIDTYVMRCYFCAPYNKNNPEDLAEGDRYILSENDFAAYGLADEVLGKGWNE